MARVFGIDLGTTYSCIAHVDEHGKPVVVPNSEGQSTTPSVVYFETPNNIVAGETAKEVSRVHEDRVVQSVKRAMGDPNWTYSSYGRDYRPQDISSFILRKVVGDAEAELGEKIENVVITCPAYFGTAEREATKQAGELAALNVLYVIPEPTAAAIAYGMSQDKDQIVLVYDLGGGTFDVTVIAVRGGDIEVVATGGEKELGGKDWDDTVVAFFGKEFESKTGLPPERLFADLSLYQELLLDAERCKRTLSTRNSTTQKIRHEASTVSVELTRETFDAITAHLLERTILLTRDVLGRAAEKGFGTIDTLLLVGGSTYMPQVYDRVSKEFPWPIQRNDPNQIVAKGAALYGYKCQLDQEIRIRIADDTGTSAEAVELDTVPNAVREAAVREVAKAHGMALPGMRRLVDATIANVTSKSFGLMVEDDSERLWVSNMVLMDDKVPRSITRDFHTSRENQTEVELAVFENHERRSDTLLELAQCTEIGKAELTFLRALPKGAPIEVTFELTPDGLLKLHGRDLSTGQEIRAEFRADSIMTARELAESKSKNLSMKVS